MIIRHTTVWMRQYVGEYRITEAGLKRIRPNDVVKNCYDKIVEMLKFAKTLRFHLALAPICRATKCK